LRNQAYPDAKVASYKSLCEAEVSVGLILLRGHS
jgi:hypothetical protein